MFDSSMIDCIERELKHDYKVCLNIDRGTIPWCMQQWKNRGADAEQLGRTDMSSEVKRVAKALLPRVLSIKDKFNKQHIDFAGDFSTYIEKVTEPFSSAICEVLSQLIPAILLNDKQVAISLTGSLVTGIATPLSDIDVDIVFSDNDAEIHALPRYLPDLYYALNFLGLRLCGASLTRAFLGLTSPLFNDRALSQRSWYRCHRIDELIASRFVFGQVKLYESRHQHVMEIIQQPTVQEWFRESVVHHEFCLRKNLKPIPNPDSYEIIRLREGTLWFSSKELVTRPLCALLSWLRVLGISKLCGSELIPPCSFRQICSILGDRFDKEEKSVRSVELMGAGLWVAQETSRTRNIDVGRFQRAGYLEKVPCLVGEQLHFYLSSYGF